MREELGLVGRHVDVDRTIALAALARQAQVERLLHIFIAPAIGENVAVQHLPQLTSTAARRVFLFVGHHEAGTHGVVACSLSLLATALPYANATQGRMREAASFFRIMEVRFRLPRLVISA